MINRVRVLGLATSANLDVTHMHAVDVHVRVRSTLFTSGYHIRGNQDNMTVTLPGHLSSTLVRTSHLSLIHI